MGYKLDSENSHIIPSLNKNHWNVGYTNPSDILKSTVLTHAYRNQYQAYEKQKTIEQGSVPITCGNCGCETRFIPTKKKLGVTKYLALILCDDCKETHQSKMTNVEYRKMLTQKMTNIHLHLVDRISNLINNNNEHKK